MLIYIYSLLKNRIEIKGKKGHKQVRHQRSTETNKDGAQVLLENKKSKSICHPYSDYHFSLT